ncbi:acyl-CoA dehydrogenase family protein [Dactylosporangium sp. NPDC051485]|uniref:acyl-CoA dehydrogenase family protein n=1 Tax=Dactylosporangium sp. NPDC051485 TaxID=3154846 RepID=UPI003435B1E4
MRDVDALVTATSEFIRETVLPIDDEHDGDVEAAGGDELRLRRQAAAREAGLLSPHGPVDCGGLGLSMVQRAPVFEAAGYSRDLPIAKIAREIRPFRIYDGPSEVHRWSIAKRAVRTIAGRDR